MCTSYGLILIIGPGSVLQPTLRCKEDSSTESTRTILVMQFLDLEGVLTFQNHIVVELIPQTCSGKLWSRDMREFVKVHAVDIEPEHIEDESNGKDFSELITFHTW